jgi:hypothetical protein
MDAIEGEIVPESRLATVPPSTGTHALAMMSDAEFEANLLAVRKGQERILRMQEALLVKGVDYANIPTVDKPSLGKPGAEKFTQAYNCTAEIVRTLIIGDNITTPWITYDAQCDIHLGALDGPVIGNGFGTCNSWETKYRYRGAMHVCPDCGKDLLHSKAPKTGWYCWTKLGGCGQEFLETDERIKSQVVGRIENPDPWDLANTIMKIAEKRSHCDAVLRAFAASGIFTQDVEDNVGAMIDVTPNQTPATAVSPSGGASRRAATGTQGAVRQAAPTNPPTVNNAAMDAFLNGDPGPISDAEMAAAVDGEMPDGSPVCPNGHGPMADSQYGGFYCRTCKAKSR